MRPYSRSPLIVIWEVTQACDLACRHCRAAARPGRHPRELSTAEGIRLIGQVREFSDPADPNSRTRNPGAADPILILTGGDPLKRPDLFDLLAAAGAGLRVCLSPSGTPLLDGRAVERAAGAGVTRIALSLDAPRAEPHDDFRGVPGSFGCTLAAWRAARDLGLEVQAQTTVTGRNRDELPALADLLERAGTALWSVFFLVPTGRGRGEAMLDAAGHEEAFGSLYRLSREHPFPIKTTCAPHYRRFLAQRTAEAASDRSDAPDKSDHSAFRNPQSAMGDGVNDGKGFIFVSHTGEVFPSGFLPLSAGNVRELPLPEIYRESPLLKSLRDPARLKGKCGSCPFQRLCGGSRARAFAVTGDPLEAEPCCAFVPPGYPVP